MGQLGHFCCCHCHCLLAVIWVSCILRVIVEVSLVIVSLPSTLDIVPKIATEKKNLQLFVAENILN